MIGQDTRGLFVPTRIEKLSIDAPMHCNAISKMNPDSNRKSFEIGDILRANIQLVLENIQTHKVKSIELVDEEYKKNDLKPILESIGQMLGDLPYMQAELLMVSKEPIEVPYNITVIENRKLVGESNAALFVGANLLGRPEILQQASSTLRNKAFIMSREKDYPKKITDKYDIVTVYDTGFEYMVLLRNRVEVKPAKFIRILAADDSFSWVDKVKEELNESQKVVLYAQDEPINGILGLVNCLRKEPGGEIVYGLLISDPSAPPFNPDLEFYEEQLKKDLAFNVYKDVYCAALNFRDVMTAIGRVTVDAIDSGRLAQECVKGIEVVGKTVNGTRVMGMVRNRGIANLVEGDRQSLCPIPDEWTFEEAATVPVAYGTVYYAMVMFGEMQRGESILIHAGSGGVGQAAINVALYYGCEVFTTVGTAEKRAFIKKLFPQLKDSHIGNSRDTSFEDMVRRETNGKGVDLVLNSLSDDKLQRLQDLLLNGIENGAVKPLTYCTFKANEVENAFRYMAAGKHIGKVIVKIRDEECGSGPVRPVPTPIDAVPRYICHEDHVYVLVGGLGGFGLELADWLIIRGARKILLNSRRGITNGYQSSRLRAWASYGADVKISTHDVTTEAGCEEMLNMALSMGPVHAIFNLAVVLSDSIFENQTPESFKISFAPKGLGTIHLDKLSRKLCPGLNSSIPCVWRVTFRARLKELDHHRCGPSGPIPDPELLTTDFVIFSSVSCGRGNAGQTNYGYSNSVMERICEDRKSAGFPALAVQWGAIADVGLVADLQEEDIQLEIAGTLQQRISSCLSVLDKLMKQDVPIVSSIVVAEKKAGAEGCTNAVDAVAQILGIKDLKTVSQQSSLAELGMDSMMALEINQTLEREFEIFLTAQDIRTLTFTRLAELTERHEASSSTSVSNATNMEGVGLRVLMRNFGDEKTASEPYVYMPTMVSDGIEASVYFKVQFPEGLQTTNCNRKLQATTLISMNIYEIDSKRGNTAACRRNA
ncbi:hypothetical protein SFRURICE_010512 [Spodoptera frugiperda]|nr:hypothetical protein SFRURICE_010512 [Spodoptera frugiperda]